MTRYRGIRVHHKMTLAERLAFYSAPDPSGCILWQRGNKRGKAPYGMLRFKGASRGAHVWAWEIANGKSIPQGLVVRHKCDVHGCINPDHLEIGTQGDNNRDRETRGRGRQPKGESSGRSKLTEAQVLAIRSDPRGGRPIAKDYGVSRVLVRYIKQRKAWKHI